MTTEDFLKLRIGHVIYYENKKRIIDTLTKRDYGFSVGFENDPSGLYTWQKIKSDCSLEAPKEKVLKRFWAWRIKPSDHSHWVRGSCYMDDEGVFTSGDRPYGEKWSEREKIKIEDDFVDVEVDDENKRAN